MKVVVDASVSVKWVVQEDGTPEALALRAHELLAPDLWAAECANVLWKKARRKEITAEHAQLGVDLLSRSAMVLLPMRSLMSAAVTLALRLDHSAYDAIYLAASATEGAPLVTADERLAARAAALALPAVLLRDAPRVLKPPP